MRRESMQAGIDVEMQAAFAGRLTRGLKDHVDNV